MRSPRSLDPDEPEPELVDAVAASLSCGNVAALPTDTFYGLAVDPVNLRAVERIYEIKTRARHKPLSLLIADVAQAAAARGRHAAVCGGLASEPLAAALLVGLGVRELSAVPAVIPQLKAQLAGVRLEACRALAVRALELESAGQVRALLGRAGGDSP